MYQSESEHLSGNNQSPNGTRAGQGRVFHVHGNTVHMTRCFSLESQKKLLYDRQRLIRWHLPKRDKPNRF